MTATDLVLPVLDLSQFDAGPDQRSAFLREVRDAARGPGFFYLIGHGIGEDLTGEVLELSRRFFSLPEPAKLEIEMINSPHSGGITAPASSIRAASPTGGSRSISVQSERRCHSVRQRQPGPGFKGRINGLRRCRTCGPRCCVISRR